MEQEVEIWKPVVGLELEFEISSYGKLRSIDRWLNKLSKTRTPYVYLRKGRDRITILQKSGYISATLNNKTFIVHRLVAQAFISNPENKRCVNHIDGNKSNNYYKNLEWCTHSENAYHAHRTKLAFSYNGVQNVHSKLTEDDVRTIRRLRTEGYTCRELSEIFPVSNCNVSRICLRKSYKNVI